jgi:hypothetical protein
LDSASLTDLGYITAIANLGSIREHGILSHARAETVPHVDISMEEIQDRRTGKRVPDARRATPLELHDYANLYICPRNPMLRKRQSRHEELCVVRVDPSVVDLDGVVIADGNASSDYTRFGASPSALALVNEEMTFAEYWTDDNRYAYWEKKRRKCAEVLVPDCVDPGFIVGAYVSCESAARQCEADSVPWPVTIDPHLFFLE